MNLPLVSIIMPVRNEGRFIERSLEAALNQDYPSDQVEILVVDGMSTDATREYVEGIITKYPDRTIRLLDNPKRIMPSAVNLGLRQAKGDAIVLVGGHCVLLRNYIGVCVQLLEETGAACVGGQMETIGETEVAQAIAICQGSAFGVGNAAFRTGSAKPGFVDTVAFGVYRRDWVNRIGGFDERLVRHQDYEFNLRLRQAGGKIYYAPQAQVRYYSRGTLSKLWGQYYQYGYWKALVTKENPAAFTYRHAAPPLLVFGLVAGALLGLALPVVRWMWLALLGLYAVANLMACVVTAGRRGWRYLPLLPVIFALLHFSWGIGFGVGLFSKRLDGARRKEAMAHSA